MQRTVFSQKFFSIPDLIIVLLISAVIYSVIAVSSEWRAEYNPVTQINLSLHALPFYTLMSAVRGIVAYLISLTFAVCVGYLAAKSRKAEQIIVPMLDILQSIPVLGFLPGLVIALVAIFPNSNIGLELVAILAIFTGQAWNMTFSFYSSLRSIPTEFDEAVTIMGLSRRQRLFKVELPYSAVNLAWNSLLSMAGGWFFLTVAESVTLGQYEYRLPGIGSYMAVAIQQGNVSAMFAGIGAMISLILVMDFLIWRPILSWVQRFRLEDVPGAKPEEPLIELIIRESKIVRFIKVVYRRWVGHRRHEGAQVVAQLAEATPVKWVKLARQRSSTLLMPALEKLLSVLIIGIIIWGSFRLLQYLFAVPVPTWILLLRNTVWTFLRVFVAVLLSTLWAVPVGIWIGTSPRRIRVAQPVIQVLASFPAPMLYPLALGVILYLGISFEIGSMFLMLLGVQWYVLFNVLAGALRIPQELKYALNLMEASPKDRWMTLYIPSVFPSLVTGWVTAAGGAWNASIVAEYVSYKGGIFRTNGIGATITAAAAGEDFKLLAASLTLMVFFVLVLNRMVWTPMYRLSQTRYRLDY